MNKQKVTSKSSIEWTRIVGSDGAMRDGYTWNPVGGCFHDCKWQMPDGTVAQCYAKSVAEKVARGAYNKGFEHHYWNPHKLDEPKKVKHPAGIFIDSMSDLFGHWVEENQIQRVLDVCTEADWHIFQVLTKNAPRLLKFNMPENMWVGVSSPPDWFMGNKLDAHQQEAMLRKSLQVLMQVNARVKWMSFEPLSWDVSAIVEANPVLRWAVIGAASNGRNEFPPDEAHLKALLDVLDPQDVPVFFKGNLKSLDWARDNWRADFPTDVKEAPKQMALL